MPTFLKTKLFVDFSKIDEYEFSFDTLIRTIHQSPLYKKPEVGNNPFAKPIESDSLKTEENLELKVLKFIVTEYERHRIRTSDEIRGYLNMPRIRFDIFEKKVLSKSRLFYCSPKGYWYLFDAGKEYAINQNWV